MVEEDACMSIEGRHGMHSVDRAGTRCGWAGCASWGRGEKRRVYTECLR